VEILLCRLRFALNVVASVTGPKSSGVPGQLTASAGTPEKFVAEIEAANMTSQAAFKHAGFPNLGTCEKWRSCH
jgi:hypothetical protein